MRITILCWMLLLFTGCALQSHGLIDRPEPTFYPYNYGVRDDSQRAPGSIYAAKAASNSLISDTRAYRVNDIVMISIAETTSATSTATTDLDKANSTSLTATAVPDFLGMQRGLTSLLGNNTGGNLLSTGTTLAHEGKGTTVRSGTFTASVAARVVEVLPNGHLFIQGFKEVAVNGEREKVFLSGIVDPMFIARNNIISSNQVADLQLRYGGAGVITAHQNPGLFYRILNLLWPF